MFKTPAGFQTLLLLLFATILEVSGDAVVRKALYEQIGWGRVGLILAGGTLLLGYGTLLNLAPVEFGRVVGLYIATLFIIWQLITYLAFRTTPTMPVLLGGALIVAGGAIVTLWRPA